MTKGKTNEKLENNFTNIRQKKKFSHPENT